LYQYFVNPEGFKTYILLIENFNYILLFIIVSIEIEHCKKV